MPESIEFNSTDRSILRSNTKPLRIKGDAFHLMKLEDFPYEIRLSEDVSPNDPITLFTIYYTSLR